MIRKKKRGGVLRLHRLRATAIDVGVTVAHEVLRCLNTGVLAKAAVAQWGQRVIQ